MTQVPTPDSQNTPKDGVGTQAIAAIRRARPRAWSAVVHPNRRGLPDPTWSQVSVAMIALGSVLIAVAAAGPRQPVPHVPDRPFISIRRSCGWEWHS